MKNRALPFLIYKHALLLYPPRFRREYQDKILQTLNDAHYDRSARYVQFWLRSYADLVGSACMEHIMAVRLEALKQPILLHAVFLGLILTLLGGAAAVTVQQMLRQGADQPQIDMVNYYASQIASGANPRDAIPPGYVDPEQNLESFVIFYDEQGKPEKSTGYLHQSVPTPPPGVFGYVRNHGSENFTWQPNPRVRIATVIRHLSGSRSGFVLAGRSLRVVEESELLLYKMTFLGWFLVVSLLVLGGTALQRAQRVKPSTA